MSSRYRPTGVDPVARPRTVVFPAAFRARTSLSISRATYFDAATLFGKTTVGTRVCGSGCRVDGAMRDTASGKGSGEKVL
jgi:hypothetical protein